MEVLYVRNFYFLSINNFYKVCKIADYSFPYIIFILSIVSSAAHFAIQLDQSVTSLIVSTLMDKRNIVILFGHWVLHAYGIVSITQLTKPALHTSLIVLVPLPALFYILTARFTDPSKLHID